MDLFDDIPVPGLGMQTDFVSAMEEQDLIARIDGLDMAPFRFQQWSGKRLSQSFGWHYDFQTGKVSPAEPMPAWLQPLRERVACFAALDPAELQQALLLKYGPGAGISWHRDRPQFEHVFGVSLGTAVNMRFRRRVQQRWQRVSVPLAGRSLYRLSGEVRHDWEHSIVELAEGVRYSITFRTLSAMGHGAASRQ
ncbi:MAG TPA: alpha-ketoglutarate-dependent dioxygenase AlkB [Pseudomonadales bacterium]